MGAEPSASSSFSSSLPAQLSRTLLLLLHRLTLMCVQVCDSSKEQLGQVH